MARVVRKLASVAFSDISEVFQWKGAVKELIARKDFQNSGASEAPRISGGVREAGERTTSARG
jgi:hypothetical protein